MTAPYNIDRLPTPSCVLARVPLATPTPRSQPPATQHHPTKIFPLVLALATWRSSRYHPRSLVTLARITLSLASVPFFPLTLMSPIPTHPFDSLSTCGKVKFMTLDHIIISFGCFILVVFINEASSEPLPFMHVRSSYHLPSFSAGVSSYLSCDQTLR
jgi:hypothetical protein